MKPLVKKNLIGLILAFGLFLILAQKFIFVQDFKTSLALVFGLVFTAIFLYSPKIGLLLFLVARPLLDKSSENFSVYLGENISINIAALMGALFIALSALYIGKKYKKAIQNNPLAIFWIFFIIISFASIFISIDPISSIYEVIRLISIFFMFLLAYTIAREENFSKNILFAILASAVIPFCFAVYQLLTDSGLGGTSGIESRLFGTFNHPNSFASFVILIFGILVYLLIEEKKPKINLPKPVAYGFLAISLLIIIGTYSRGAWLGTMVFLGVISILKKPKIIFAAILVLLALFFTSETFRYRVEDVYNPPATSSVRWRFQQWDKMFSAYLKKPITGYGAGTETIVHESQYGFYAGNPYTHNDFLKAFLETGIAGGTAYFLLVLATMATLFSRYIKTREVFALVVLALFAAEITFSLTSNIFRGTATEWTLWALIGTALAPRKN